MVGKLTPLQQERRDKILDAAARHFSRVGFAKGDLDEISRIAGVGKGTIYRYFENKNDLFVQTVTYQFERLFEFIWVRVQPVEDPGAAVKMIIDAGIEFLAKNLITIDRILMSEGSSIKELLESVVNCRDKYYQRFAKIINNGIVAGRFRNVHEFIFLRSLDGSLLYLMFEHSRRKEEISIDDIRKNLYTIYLDSLVLK